ncbi:hypothetical protein MAR_034632 [Mya arenaria]|uniref:Uncharacterized protein n=1 Tax=Mya arenaria TaxID=6604 RepID=A0ABY7EL79_MYAAR|nr:hypothetical protein MAR_034632 [Mya arenaria]
MKRLQHQLKPITSETKCNFILPSEKDKYLLPDDSGPLNETNSELESDLLQLNRLDVGASVCKHTMEVPAPSQTDFDLKKQFFSLDIKYLFIKIFVAMNK